MCQRTPTVFVVEDDPDMRLSLAALISSLGLAVETFASGEDLLQNLDASRPGCAVVDFRLGGMDGIELQRQLARAGAVLPVILLSGYLTERAMADAVRQGVFRILEKPHRDDELTVAIAEAIEHDRAMRRRME